jgi:alkanesulfonate monooxygenase SsuD/methylene tetrahydromethanopterin reductase-like flavin-dependent oxidoreductase (luciferase family)
MRLGALVLQEQPWHEARHTWQLVEDLGFDAAYAADHLTHDSVAGRWWADCWTTLAAAAGVTERMRIGTLVASSAVRSATVLARSASTLQDISGGRFVLGLGAGLADDARADRGAALGAAELWERYEETVSAVRALWLGSATWAGRVVALDGVVPAPHAPGQLPPKVVLAAGGPRGFDLVARQGDGWVTYGGSALTDLEPDAWWRALADQSREVTRACERIVRDPVSVQRSVLVGYGTYRPLQSVESFVDAVGRATEAGFDEVVVYAPMGSPGDRFWCDAEVFAAAVGAVRGALRRPAPA